MKTAQTELITIDELATIREDFEHQISEIEKQCLAISIVNVEDRVGQEAAKDYRGRVRKMRTTIKKLLDEKKRPFLDMQRELIDLEKYITGMLKPSEDHLDAQLKRIDDEKKRIEDEKARAAEIEYDRRVKLLVDLGAPIDPAAVRAMLPQEFELHLKLAEIAKADRDEAEAEEAARRKAELEQQAKDKAELELLRQQQARRDAEAKAAQAAEQPVSQEVPKPWIANPTLVDNEPKPFITDTIPASNEPEPGVIAGPPGTRTADAEEAARRKAELEQTGLAAVIDALQLAIERIPADAYWAKKAENAIRLAMADVKFAAF